MSIAVSPELFEVAADLLRHLDLGPHIYVNVSVCGLSIQVPAHCASESVRLTMVLDASRFFESAVRWEMVSETGGHLIVRSEWAEVRVEVYTPLTSEPAPFRAVGDDLMVDARAEFIRADKAADLVWQDITDSARDAAHEAAAL